MGKTTVFVDEALIDHALRVSKLKTKKEVIEAGLKELVRKKNQELLRQELGSFDMDLPLDELKRRRAGK
jgi:Arc/MetJ family transcription regulator